MSRIDCVLRRLAARLAVVLFAAITAISMAPGEARALNVPGSVVGGFVLDNVFYVAQDAGSLAQKGGGFTVSTGGKQLASLGPAAGSQFDGFISAGEGTDLGLSFTVDYRNLDLNGSTMDLDYDLVAGSAALGYALDENLTLIGGVIFEYGTGSSDFNQGTIEGAGFGAFVGGIYTINDNWSFTGIGAVEKINFDVTRASGAFTGDYDALRVMLGGEVDYHQAAGALDWRIAAGARYIHQNSESYQETGGGVFVPSISESVFSLTARGKVGYQLGGGLTPFADLNLRYDISEDTSTTGGVVSLNESISDWGLRPGVGIEWLAGPDMRFLAQSGIHFSGDGYDGFDVRLNAQFRF